MIKGIGTDIINIERVADLLREQEKKFLERVFTPSEREAGIQITNEAQRASYFAKRWAAKEACAKALGCGIGAALSFQDLDIAAHSDTGAPILTLTGQHAGLYNAHLSLSDEPPFALAFVVLEAKKVEI